MQANSRISIRHFSFSALLAFAALLCLAVPQAVRAADDRPAPRSAYDKHDRVDLAAKLAEQGEVQRDRGAANAAGAGAGGRSNARSGQGAGSRDTPGAAAAAAGGSQRARRQAAAAAPFRCDDGRCDGLAALLADPEVTSVSEDILVYPVLFETPGITRADKAWIEGARGAGQVVAIVDSGVDKTHPFFVGKVVAKGVTRSHSTPVVHTPVLRGRNGPEHRIGQRHAVPGLQPGLLARHARGRHRSGKERRALRHQRHRARRRDHRHPGVSA